MGNLEHEHFAKLRYANHQPRRRVRAVVRIYQQYGVHPSDRRPIRSSANRNRSKFGRLGMSDLRFEDPAVRSHRPARSGFHLGKDRAKLMGVCAGIADYLGVDVTLVRVAWAIGTLVGFGSLILIYLAIGFIAD